VFFGWWAVASWKRRMGGWEVGLDRYGFGMVWVFAKTMKQQKTS